MAADPISDRALNRATLARQLLLERSDLPVDAAVAHLVGLQAQNPLDPHLALWSRLVAYDPVAASELLEDRRLVRIVIMRGTIHLIGADDARWIRPLVQPVLDAEIARHPDHAPNLAGVDLDPVLAFVHGLLGTRPMAGGALRAALAEQFPDLDAPALAYACRCHLPLVQVPPRGMWGRSAQVTLSPLDTWTGRPVRRDGTVDDLVLRYLAAFGPSTTADVAAWCRLTGVGEVLERLVPQLRRSRDDRGRELHDLPDAPRPDAEAPAPVRFLPEYDNVLLSHADRGRFERPGGLRGTPSRPPPGHGPGRRPRAGRLVDRSADHRRGRRARTATEAVAGARGGRGAADRPLPPRRGRGARRPHPTPGVRGSPPMPRPPARWLAAVALVALAALTAACSSDDAASPTTSAHPRTTMATSSVPPTTASTDPLDVAYDAAGYETPIPDEIRVAVHTFCTAAPADITANLTDAMRAPLEVGVRVECPERLPQLTGAPTG